MIRYNVYTKTGERSCIWCDKEKDGTLIFGKDNNVTISRKAYDRDENYIRDLHSMLKSIRLYYPIYWKELVVNGYVEEVA